MAIQWSTGLRFAVANTRGPPRPQWRACMHACLAYGIHSGPVHCLAVIIAGSMGYHLRLCIPQTHVIIELLDQALHTAVDPHCLVLNSIMCQCCSSLAFLCGKTIHSDQLDVLTYCNAACRTDWDVTSGMCSPLAYAVIQLFAKALDTAFPPGCFQIMLRHAEGLGAALALLLSNLVLYTAHSTNKALQVRSKMHGY